MVKHLDKNNFLIELIKLNSLFDLNSLRSAPKLSQRQKKLQDELRAIINNA
tara:strand:+ start:964 stop:1116 length:153 start_codon:yes stop_codon:yes gene_type:complete